MLVSKINSSQQSNSYKPFKEVSFGMNSNLLSHDTNILLEKVVNKFNKKNELFADTLLKTRSRFEKRQGAIIEMPDKINEISSFKTGLKSSIKLEVPASKGVKLRFSDSKGYKGDYVSIEKIMTGPNGNQETKYEISDDWIDIICDDKKKNITYTTSQLPEYQRKMFQGTKVESFINPQVHLDIQKVDQDIAECLNQLIKGDKGLLNRLKKLFGKN